jgi:hypothetical protein
MRSEQVRGNRHAEESRNIAQQNSRPHH